MGRHSFDSSNPGTNNVSVLGVMCGIGNFSLSEWQAFYDAFVSTEDFQPIAGKTTRLWSVKRSQNGTLQPIPDAMGSGETMTITGSPTLSPFYAHAVA